MKTYPTVCSRTLDPSNKSLITVVGLHDNELADADINLMQDLQDQKRQRLLEDQVTSGCLTYSPMTFNPYIENTFFIPSFDVLFNGEVVTVTGDNSTDFTINRVALGSPNYWTSGMTGTTTSIVEDACVYVVFLELWYQSLDPTTGQGYFRGPSGLYFYPYGCINANSAAFNNTVWADDSVSLDTNNNSLYTTERAQLQWGLNVQRVASSYDFTKYQAGLDPGARPTEIVYAQTSNASPIVDPVYQFTNMGTITGDTGVWWAGDGNPDNSLGTMDGYSYAMPVAVVFQRNTGIFNVANNIFGCTDAKNPSSGLIRYGASGRFDSKMADQVFPDDVVDTRQTINLDGWDYNRLVRDGFSDLVLGNSQSTLARGESPGLKTAAVGSVLDYYVTMAPSASTSTNIDRVGSWDGFANGFSSDLRTFKVTQRVDTDQKTSGATGTAWAQGDTITLQLPLSSTANIVSASLQALVGVGVKTPVNILAGQITVTGLGSNAVTIKFSSNLSNTPFDPGSNHLYVTLGVQYPAGTGTDLKKIPLSVQGGILNDSIVGALPVYGVSEYEIQADHQPQQAMRLLSMNPEYSSSMFGTRIWVKVLGSTGVKQTANGATTTTFIIDRTGGGAGLNNKVNGLYPTRVWDLQSGSYYTVSNYVLNNNQCIITIQSDVSASSTLVMSFLAQNTAQLVYNAPVRGVTEIEETVLFGTYTGNTEFPMDSRVAVESYTYNSVTNTSTVVLAPNNAVLKGISGDDTNKFVWVLDSAGTGNLSSVVIAQPNFNGIVSVDVPGFDLTKTPFMFCGSILPAFDSNSSLTVQLRYVPYQGEGTTGRDYEILHVEDNALITTNGTGAAPVPGLSDVYPYNRELPIITMMPSQVNWNDATLTNTAVATFFDSNYEAMRMNNVEHTFLAPLHTNDFIQPMNKDVKKSIRLAVEGGGRGFSQAIPHVGFAIRPPVIRTVQGQNLQATTAPITLYVNNVTGDDRNDGLSILNPKATITAALNVLPSVLLHPCAVRLVNTGVSYSIQNLQNSLETIALGDGTIRKLKYYALANIAFSVQQEGRLIITRDTESTLPGTVTIDAAGFSGFGDGPTSAFFVDSSRVIFNGIQFANFFDPAVKGINADIEFVACSWVGNHQAGSFEEGSGVVVSESSLSLPDGGYGFSLVQSTLTVSNTTLAVASAAAKPGSFFQGLSQSTLNLQTHNLIDETLVSNTTVIAKASLNSSIVVTSDFSSNGMAVLQAVSTLSKSVSTNPFVGGITQDSSCIVVTQLS